MNMPWLSIAGLMAYRPDVLDDIALPIAADMQGEEMVSRPWVPDREDLKNYLCFALAELPLVYTDPDYMKTAVRFWSTIHYKEWTDLLRTLNFKYNPLWNKDGSIRERRDITYEKGGNTTNTGTVVTENDTTSTGTVVTDNDTTSTGTVGRSGSSSGSTEHQVTGYNTNAYSPDVKDVTSNSANETTTNNLAGTDDTTVTNNLSGTDDTTVTNNLAGTAAEDGSSTDIFERTEQGNIGVTTTTQLIREQRELVQFNFYEYLTQAFKREFCVMVW